MTEFILSKVGEFALSKLFESLYDRLAVPKFWNFLGGEGKRIQANLGKWRQKLQDIQNMLDNAEEKQYSDRVVKLWLDDLKRLVYDVDDIVDELATDAFLAENQARPSKVRKLNIPGASSAHKIDSTLQLKIKEITGRFNEIMTRKDQLNLKETTDGRSHRKTGVPAPTSVLTEPEPHVYGRVKDKEAVVELLTAFTTKKDYGKGERKAQWAMAQRTIHGLQPRETLFNDKSNYRELSEIAEQAKRRAEIARLRELNTLKGHVESVVKLKGLDIETIQQHYTV